ncbi:MAG: hypothetical protein DMG65_08310 [Candidatus Angelobacter sp. Gp1-AA117]|nr:MAG: hypothetical protein DMG65_08310 [Candidatus Angelobacter sp. Gp1-AA117]
MRFEWDENKNQTNLEKHGIEFKTAALVFNDPNAVTLLDHGSEDEERWIIMGMLELSAAILVVVHTVRESGYEEIIHIISARTATSREKRVYEEAHENPKKADTNYRSKKRRGY